MSNNENIPAVDPMDNADISVSYPLLQANRIIRMEVRKPFVQTNEETGKENFTIPLYTTDEQTSTKGDTLHAGFKCTARVALTPTEKYPIENVAKNLTRWRNAAGLAKSVTPRQLKENPSLLDGVFVNVKIGISPERDGYPESNSFNPVAPE